MKKELEANLIRDFPDFFVDMYRDATESCMHFGCCCGDGWYDLIYETCVKIKQNLAEKDDFKFSQIKEKFGGLRLYYEHIRVTPAGKEPSSVYKITDEAENESFKICEACGTRDNVSQDGTGWICTLCPDCRRPDLKEKK